MSCPTGTTLIEQGKFGAISPLNFNATVSVECGVKDLIWQSSVMTVGINSGEVGFGSTFGSLAPLSLFGQDVEYLRIVPTNWLYFKWVWPAPDYPPTILVRFNDYSDDPLVLTGGDDVWMLQVPQAFTDWLTALDGQDTPFEMALVNSGQPA